MIEQPIPGTPVYRVRAVTGTKVRTLHRNLLLPLGVKYQPDIDSDESDSDDSVCVDTSHSRSNQSEKVSQAKSVRFHCLKLVLKIEKMMCLKLILLKLMKIM